MSLKLPKLPWVIVEWLDAWGDATEEVSAKNAGETHKPTPMLTTGWLLIDDEEGVSLASENAPNHGTFRTRSFIPRGMVVAVHHFNLSKPRVKKSPPVSISPV